MQDVSEMNITIYTKKMLGTTDPVKVFVPLKKLEMQMRRVEMNMNSEQPFIAGRMREISKLEDIIEKWVCGQRALVVISGSSGYGKSALSKVVSYSIQKDDKVIAW